MTSLRKTKKIWKVYEENPRLRNTLCSELGVSPQFAQILLNRGIKTPETAQFFLFGKLSSCHDPFLMKDMEKSVLRIKKAIAQKEKILIHGDYDVDGVSSTAVLSLCLDKMGGNYETLIPNRLEEGYGFNSSAVTLAREKGIKLIITVDCGINSFNEIRYANEHGIDVIITDHHEINEEGLPPAYAVIDTRRPDCAYPFKDLAGVGVTYKLARALMKGEESAVDSHLDLVVLGTIADIVPLTGENRILAKAGLKKLKATDKCGLKALMDAARLSPENLSFWHISFMLGPRINATGRVGSADAALNLLLCRDTAHARSIAQTLERENKTRQAIEKRLLEDVTRLMQDEGDLKESNVIILAGEAWHPGVLGIVASKMTEEYDLPAILITLEGEKGKGSGRSVEGFNLFETLKKVSGHLIDFGGHEAACGIKIKRNNIASFKKSLNAVAERCFVPPELKIDLSLPFSHIGIKLIKELEMLMPYGAENIAPVFSTNHIKVKTNPRDIGRGGFKFLATCGSLTCEAITFKKNKVVKPARGNVINLAYTPSINSWKGIETIQLNIKDLQLVS